MRALVRLYFIVVYYLSWLLFGLVGLTLNLVCAVLLLWPRREQVAPAVRLAIRRLLSGWLAWLHVTRIVPVRFHGFDGRLPHPAVYVANHPSLVDAPFLLARLPGAICIFKPSLQRNPVIAPAAIMAGYTSGAGIDLIRQTAARVAGGVSLLIFPEGTRTSAGALLNPFKPGFALIAARAGVPIQLVVIRMSRSLVPRGQPWWRVPPLPAPVDLYLDRCLPFDPEQSTIALTAEVHAFLESRLAS